MKSELKNIKINEQVHGDLRRFCQASGLKIQSVAERSILSYIKPAAADKQNKKK